MADPNLWARLREARVGRVILVYAGASWAIVEAIDLFTDRFGLPAWFLPAALFLLLIGLVIIVATAVVQSQAAPNGPVESPATAGAGAPELAQPLHRLLTWRNAVAGGVLAFAAWGVVAMVWIVSARPADRSRDSIAVLPFSNLGGAESAYFADGIHEDILTQLSKIGSLRVISRTSVLEYRDTQKNIKEVGRELGAATILEGSVRYDAERDRVRVVAQLIDAESDEHLWADQYDRDLSDVFAIQSELALNIAEQLHTTLTPDEARRIESLPTDNLAAYDMLLRGRELYGEGVQENDRAIEYFRQAIALAPDYAEAWAELANGFGQSVQIGGRGVEWADSGIAAALRAIELDPEQPLAHKALGLNYDQSGRLRLGDESYRRALELNPNYATVMINLSATALWLGRCDEGMPLASRAHALSPRYVFPPVHLAFHNWCLDRAEEAWRWLDVARSLDPDFLFIPAAEATFYLSEGDYAAADSVAAVMSARDSEDPFGLLFAAEAALGRGAFTEAAERFERFIATAPQWGFRAASPDARSGLALARVKLGRPRAADLIDEGIAFVQDALDRGADDPDYLRSLARLHAVAGRREAALVALERAVEGGTVDYGAVSRDSRFENLRDEPRFIAAIERMKARVAEMRANVEAREPAERAEATSTDG